MKNKKLSVHELNGKPDDIRSSSANIRPVCRFVNGRYENWLQKDIKTENLYWIERYPLSGQSFMAEPLIKEKADNLVYFCSVQTRHSYFCPTVLQPTVEEVLRQLPNEVKENLSQVVAFEVVIPAWDWSIVDTQARQHILLTHFYAKNR